MKVFVTGGTGYIGSAVALRLKKAGHDVPPRASFSTAASEGRSSTRAASGSSATPRAMPPTRSTRSSQPRRWRGDPRTSRLLSTWRRTASAPWWCVRGSSTAARAASPPCSSARPRSTAPRR
ncbi:MAG: NAD-dependent epimerase/dehydratase family protein [Deltaproteobacteria bacterium]|nr:MAG: NAD-dependent epimerase/dehydratase family protein [Deltaproteobacteria bacterium]